MDPTSDQELSMSSLDETVIIVDEGNREVGTTARSRMRRCRLPHRATFVFVFDSTGRLFVHKRTRTKDLYPGFFDAAAGGVVVEGESYQRSAVREAGEELGLVGVELEPRFDFYHENDGNRCWGRVFTCRSDGPFQLQPEEVEDGMFVSIGDVLDGTVSPITPDSLAALKRLLGRDPTAGSITGSSRQGPP